MVRGLIMSWRAALILLMFAHIQSTSLMVEGLGMARGKSSKQASNNQATMLAKAFRIMYNEAGTPGVLEGCRNEITNYSATVLVEAALEASRGQKGMASGILNALIACCCYAKGGDKMAINLMKAYDDIGEQNSLKADLVALSLAYVATSRGSGGANSKEIPDTFLRRAEAVFSSPGKELASESSKTIPSTDWARLAENHGIQLLQDADEYVVLSKPSGMVCYHAASKQIKGGSGPSKKSKKLKQRKEDLSLEDCLLRNGVPLSTLNLEGRGLVHRIDRGTSGCLVVAKTNRMHAKLMAEFFLRRLKKSYQALICAPRDSLPKNMGFVQMDIDGRPARSKYSIEKPVGRYATRIKVETEQGRRHQVRIHCSEGLRAPILLDPLYGGQSIMSKLKNDIPSLLQARAGSKFCLHAHTLVLEEFGINAKAPLPDWWKHLENELEAL